MIRFFALIASFALVVACPSAQARETRVLVPLQDVIDAGQAQGKLDGSVRFYLAGGESPMVERRFGEGVSNKKTNAANKSDRDACVWAALSVLIRFQQSAKNQGANAVVDMVSYYKKNTFSDPAQIECYAGAIMAGVAMKGSYAVVAP